MNWRDQVKEQRAIWVFVILIAIIAIVAAYGYFTGAWGELPTQPQ